MPANGPSKSAICYHIYNCGVEKRNIFSDTQDYEVFERFIGDYLTPPAHPDSLKKVFTVHGRTFRGTPHQPKNYFGKIELLAFSLMPNHFHLVLHPKAEDALESFIRSLCTRYSMYFNKKYQRTGSLFQGPYKSAKIEKGAQLPLLVNYIHHPTSSHSSLSVYTGKKEISWVNTNDVLSAKNVNPKGTATELSKEITIEDDTNLLERRNLAQSDTNIQPAGRLPEIFALSAVFLLLLGLGLRNINSSQAKNLAVSPASAPDVLSESVEPPPPTIKNLVTVEVPEALGFVYIRQGPTADSEKVGEAENGDQFELTGVDSGWYKVKLEDGSQGFINSDHAYLEEANN